jgi:hypothetical protein
MIEGEEWKCQADAPTPADMTKYATTKARLILEIPWYGPMEVVVTKVASGGELFRCGDVGSWRKTSEVRVLALLPPPRIALESQEDLKREFYDSLKKSQRKWWKLWQR